MVFGDGIRIIWLGAFIDEDGQCHAFQRYFQTVLQPAAAVPPDAIDVLVCALEREPAPLLFAHTPAQAATLIETHHDKRIIFISSGSLGQHMVPFISAFYPHVDRFYFFCDDMKNYVEFGMKYLSCLQMFDHETDLLVRLARDISNDMIKLGEIYFEIADGKNALKCFEHALTLNNNANEVDGSNRVYLTYLKQLNGDGHDVGLIQRARNMLDQQQQSRNQCEKLLSGKTEKY